jgi:hypothetical protein
MTFTKEHLTEMIASKEEYVKYWTRRLKARPSKYNRSQLLWKEDMLAHYRSMLENLLKKEAENI